MRLRLFLLVICSTMMVAVGCERREAEAPAPAVVQEAPAPAEPSVQVLAEASLSAPAEPVYFRLVRITLPAGKTAQYAVGHSMVYQLAGTTEVSTGADSRKLGAGEGMYVPAGSLATFLAAAAADAVYLQFMLAPRADMGRALTAGEKIRVEDIFASTEPLAGLAAGNYLFNLTRMQYPAGATTRPPQERTAVGLYYVVAGDGEFGAGAAPGRVQAGTAVLAPIDGVGAWMNPGPQPLEIVFTSLAPAAETVRADGGAPN